MSENGLHIRPFPKYRISNRKQDGVFIRTAFYDPDKQEVTVFVNGRHIKDVLRSIAHENIHHSQNLDGRLVGYKGDTLGQDEKLDELEKEAYEKGNVLFRKWTEQQAKSEKPSKSFGKHMKKKISIKENKNMKRTIKLTESDLKNLINEVIMEITDNDFTFGETRLANPGQGIQEIRYRGKPIGFLSSRDRNPLSPVDEYYHIPDVEKGMSDDGWIDFKIFKNDYEGALQYVKDNFDEIVYLFKNGKMD